MSTSTRIAIVGGHGQIARHLSVKLVRDGHVVTGLVRSPDQFDDLRLDGAEPVLCDLEAASDAEVDKALTGSEVVVFAAGAGPGSGPERKLSLDRDGAIKSVESAVRVGAKRFVVIGAMGVDEAPDDDETFSVYLRAKRDADVAVRRATENSDLTHTIVRPGGLTNDEETGLVQVAERCERGLIPRQDVAEVVAELINTGGGVNSTFELVSGPTPIAEAVRCLT